MGTLSYESEGQKESIKFNFAVPSSLFILAIPRLTGADFSKVLMEQIEQLLATSSASTQMTVGATGQDEFFWAAAKKVMAEITYTHVVIKVVDGAAIFFAQSWQGYRVCWLDQGDEGTR